MFKRLHILFAIVTAAQAYLSTAVEAAYPDDPRWNYQRRVNRADYADTSNQPPDGWQQPYYQAPPQRQYLKSRAGTVATVSSIEGPSLRREPFEQAYQQPRMRQADWQPAPEPEFVEPMPNRAPARGSNSRPAPNANYAPQSNYAPDEGYYQDDGYAPDGHGASGYGNFNGYGPDGYGNFNGYGPDAAFGGNCCGNDCNSCGGCGPCGGCGYGGGPFYARAEYLLWWSSGDKLPPLVTTSPTGTSQLQAGVIGQPNTSVLYGNNTVNTQSRSGVRITLGKWLSPNARIEGEWFGLGTINSNFTDSSTGSPILARPFFNLQTGFTASNLIAYPSRSSGSIDISNSSNFLGAGLQATQNMLAGGGWNESYRVDFLYGFRYLGLYETFAANSNLTTTAQLGPFPIGSTFSSNDNFSTSNSFFGGNLGMMTEARSARWCFTGIGRLGIGGTAERVAINGTSTAKQPTTAAVTTAGGFYAQRSNIGNYSSGVFSVIPQLELKIGYDFTPALRFTFGYDVLYWSRVVRPGQQIDTFINPTQSGGGSLAGTPGPLFRWQQSDLWVQGISTGLEYRY